MLVVDDDASIRGLVSSLLAEEGYRVNTATNGDAALASLRLDPPDAIVLDIQMPGLDGWELREAQLAMPEARHIPVVVITAGGRAQPPSPELAPAATLPKPFDLVQLVAAIEGVLGVGAAVPASEAAPGADPEPPPAGAPGLLPA